MKKHAFVDCKLISLKNINNYYVCTGDNFDFNLDLGLKNQPELHLNYINLTDSGIKGLALRSKKSQSIALVGKYVKCPEEPKELIIINQ